MRKKIIIAEFKVISRYVSEIKSANRQSVWRAFRLKSEPGTSPILSSNYTFQHRVRYTASSFGLFISWQTKYEEELTVAKKHVGKQ